MHLGLIVDETPDYLLDNTFTGVDVYSVATMGILGAKINRQEIKEIKEAIGMEENTITIQDFGSLKLSGSEQWINFKNKFSSRLGKNDLPVITVTSNKPGVVVSVTEKSEKGFKVVSSDPSVIIDYIAIAEVQVKNNAESENQEISPELMNSLRVDKSKKQLMWNYLEEFKKNQEEAEKQAKIEGEKLKMQRFREMELPADFERPENSPKHDPKANDPDEHIRKHNEKLKQQEGGPAPATKPHSEIMEKEAAENLKNYKPIPADMPMKETPPSEPNIENTPR